MDALEFTRTHLHELRARLAQTDDKSQDQPDHRLMATNFGLTPTQAAARFLVDQGYEFVNIDLDAMLAMAADVSIEDAPPPPAPQHVDNVTVGEEAERTIAAMIARSQADREA